MPANRQWLIIVVVFATLLAVPACTESGSPAATYPAVDREEAIPNDIQKQGPETDLHPPILHSTAYEKPVPLPHPVNTAGAEDSPFILPDGDTLYFFFTPDVRLEAEEQLQDDVTGIWVTRKAKDAWSEPERVWLQEPGKLALDGAVSIQDDEMWFTSAREGYSGVNLFMAERVEGKWANWQYGGDRLMEEIQAGEVHLHGDRLYFHSDRAGGKGDLDIWVTTRSAGAWSDPINVEAVNSSGMDAYPFVSADGRELWFTRRVNGTPGIFRSLKKDGTWSPPELIVSQFAGEPTLDSAGNLYFVHHFFENGVMVEADLYVAYKR